MADRYLNDALIDKIIGSSMVAGLTTSADSDIDKEIHIEFATAAVKTRLKNSGYARPSTSTPATDAELDAIDPYIKMATFAVFYEMLCASPLNSLSLPEGWEDSEYKLSLAAIESGAATLEQEPDTTSAVGGVLFSDPDEYPQQFSREELEGY